jgi:hypothetical protein
MNISLQFGTGALSNALSGRTNLPALSTIEDTNVGVWLDETTHNYALSVVVTGVSWSEVRAGDGGYQAAGPAFYTFSQTTSLPYQVQTITGTRKGLVIALSATGAANANGYQTGIYTVTLSGVALSGANVRVPVDNTTVTAPYTLVDADLTPYATAGVAGSPITVNFSQKEAQRKRLLGYI